MYADAISGYDPFDAAVIRDPYPYYAWLRHEAPVYYNADRDIWALSRYADVMAAARNTKDFSSAMGVGPQRQPLQQMITQDPPLHTRLRGLVNRAFTPRVIEELTPRIREIVDDLLDAVVAKGSFELVADLAFPLPVIVIAELLGVPPEDRDAFKRWSDESIDFVSSQEDTRDTERYGKSWNEFSDYFSAMIEERRSAPRNDLVSLLVKANEGDDELSVVEILNFCQLLLVAGNETTTNLITNAALALFANKDIRPQVQADPSTIPAMVEEALRFDGPVQLLYRTALQPIEIHGQTIPAGSKVALLWGAANRDGENFPDPDRFSLGRSPNPHLGFGYGIHYCLGAPLARLEAVLFTEAANRRFKYLGPDPDDPPERLTGALIRGLARYPLLFEAA